MGALLLLVLLAATFSALPERYRLKDFPRFGADYPIRIELIEVQVLTEQRDLAEHRAVASGRLGQSLNVSDEILLNPLLFAPPGTSEQQNLPTLTEAGGADQSSISSTMPAPTTNTSGLPGIMAIDFNLEGGPDSSSTLAASMVLQHDGQVVGRIGIRVDNNSVIYIAREDLLRTVPSIPIEVQRLEDDFILLSTLRSSGVNLRYDPISDTLVLVD